MNELNRIVRFNYAASAPAEDTGLSADARQAGMVTTDRAPVMGGGRLSCQTFTRFLATRAFTWRLTFRSSSSSLVLS